MKKISTCIIILNWNGIEYTKKCLYSLLKIIGVHYKIIVIDNGSKADEASQLKKIFGEKIELYALKHNVGFTGGMNYGMEKAQKYHPDYFLLLNNDTEVDKYFLKNLIMTASSDPEIGVASPMIYDFIDRKKVIFSGGYVNWFFGKTFHKTDESTSVRVCPFITGCCFLIKKEVIKKIGFLDSRFFAYFEDAAYSLSTTKAGYTCVCDPSAIIYHKESASMEKAGPFKTYLVSRNRILFVNNYAPKLIRYYFPLYNFLKLLVALSVFTLTKQKKRTYAYLRGYIDGTGGIGGIPNL